MKVVKSLLLGTAAGLIAVGGAQAADLPVKAKAVEYVKICSLYGAGFYYIPGTDTCIKLGGYLRAEVALNAGGNYSAAYNGVSGANNRLIELLFGARSRGPQHRYPYRDRVRRGSHLLRRGVHLDDRQLYAEAARQQARPVYSATRSSGRQRSDRLEQRNVKASTARSRAVRSASTMPSSSSPASPWVRPCRSSTRPGPTIPATTSTSSSVAAAPPTASPSSPTRPISARA